MSAIFFFFASPLLRANFNPHPLLRNNINSMGVGRSFPIPFIYSIIYGESECGKSSLLHLLAKLHKKEESMIVVHLGEQIDSKVQVLIT